MTLTTGTGPKGLYPDESFNALDVVPEALLYQLATIAGSVQGDEPAVRVPYVAEDPSVGFVAEGAQIDTDNPELDEIVVNTGKLAVISRQSNESASYGQANTVIANSLSRAVTVRANTALLANPESPTGLLNTAGIQDAGTLEAGNLDVIADAITAIEIAGGTATHITMDPASWGTIQNIKIQDGSALPLLGAPADQTERRLFGVPVIVSAQMAEGNILVSDQSQIIAVAGQIQLMQSDHYFYGLDSLARRVTWRVGWGVVRPDRLAKIAVTNTP